MNLIGQSLETKAYIQSETEFYRARDRSKWERLWNMILRRNPHLINLHKVVAKPYDAPVRELGLYDIPLAQIGGSLSRSRDFTPSFAPRFERGDNKERWRAIYTRAVTGRGFPPVKLLKVGTDYFVEDGHHRISVAKHLGWQTIQAEVSELLPETDGSLLDMSTCRAGSLCPRTV